MRRFLSALFALALFAAPAAASETARHNVLSRMFTTNDWFGMPASSGDPFTCNAGAIRSMYYDTATDTVKFCNGSAWSGLGGVSSPVSGDYVWTGQTTFGTAAAAGNAVDLGETAGRITFEGATADAFEGQLGWTDPTVGDQTILLPNLAAAGSDTVAVRGLAQTFTQTQTFNGSGTAAVFNARTLSNTYLLDTAGGESGYRWLTSLTPDSAALTTGTSARSLNIFEEADTSFDFQNGPCGTSACTNPTLIVRGAAQNTAHWLAAYHDQSNAQIASGTGGIVFTTSGAARFAVDGAGHLLTAGTAPAITSCGTSPSTITGNDISGRFTWGTGDTDATCTITFATAYSAAPTCIVNNETTIVVVRAVTTTTVLTIDAALAASVGGDVITYSCIQ